MGDRRVVTGVFLLPCVVMEPDCGRFRYNSVCIVKILIERESGIACSKVIRYCLHFVENKRCIVCDPTYINADIGQAMPQYKQTVANVTKIE